MDNDGYLRCNEVIELLKLPSIECCAHCHESDPFELLMGQLKTGEYIRICCLVHVAILDLETRTGKSVLWKPYEAGSNHTEWVQFFDDFLKRKIKGHDR